MRLSFFPTQLPTVDHFVPYPDPQHLNADKCLAIPSSPDRSLVSVRYPLTCSGAGSPAGQTQQLMVTDKLLTRSEHIHCFNT